MTSNIRYIIIICLRDITEYWIGTADRHEDICDCIIDSLLIENSKEYIHSA